MSRSVGVMWILPVTPSWSLVLYGVHTSVFAISWSFLILQVGSGFSSDFGEFAFLFRISVSISFVYRFIQFRFSFQRAGPLY